LSEGKSLGGLGKSLEKSGVGKSLEKSLGILKSLEKSLTVANRNGSDVVNLFGPKFNGVGVVNLNGFNGVGVVNLNGSEKLGTLGKFSKPRMLLSQ